MPAVAQFLRVAKTTGWGFAPGATFLVGENGSGKSTLVEGIAEAAGRPAGGGWEHARRAEHAPGRYLRHLIEE